MLLKDLHNSTKPVSIAYSSYETSHVSLETNLTCNLKCRACYNQNKDYVKSFEQIKKEIKIATEIRNLETITIVGGEPTLHPKLPEIIRYIEDQKIYAQLLSNGIVFLEDDDDKLLKECIAAGVRRIVIHIDEGQAHYHGNIKKALKKVFDKLESHKVPFALSITVYNENKLGISDLIKRNMHYRYFDGVLGILERDFKESMQKKPTPKSRPKLEDVYHAVADKLEIEPSAYLPSSAQEDYISWMIYLFLINTKTGATFRISPSLFKLSRTLVRMRTGTNPSCGFYSRKTFRLSLIVLFTLQSLLKPSSLGAFRKIIKGSAGLRNIRMVFINLQNPPEYNSEKGILQFCYHCPDATIRNGKLIPVCVADFISPLQQDIDLALQYPGHKHEIADVVHKHLDNE